MARTTRRARPGPTWRAPWRVTPGQKCYEAYVDRAGNATLNTRSTSTSKAGRWANRQIRRAGKLQARLGEDEALGL